MSVPSNRQRLARDHIETIEFELKNGLATPGEDLLSVVERCLGHPLPKRVRRLFPNFSSPAKPRKGRPRNDRGVEDFIMEELDERYVMLLRTFRSENDAKARAEFGPPSERAYRQLVAELNDVFPGIDWRALQNKHSAWRTGRFYSSEVFVDSEDFDADIERQFPAH